ncbi:MAG: adenylate/guanylate cyclase domain-containing protein [Gammaproteobacteria bacterium]
MTASTTITGLRRFLLTGRRLPITLGLLITLLVCWVHVLPPAGIGSLVERLDNLLYDQRFNLMPKPVKNPDNKIVIVDIDERSLQAEGQWPWDRFKVGQLVEKLTEYGVIVTGFDVTFPEPQRNAMQDLLRRVDRNALDGSFVGRMEEIERVLDADTYMANAIADPAMEVVLAISFNPVEQVEYGQLPASIVAIDPQVASQVRLQEMAGFTANIPVLQSAAAGAGIMNQLPDVDGIIRRVPLVVRYNNVLYPTLALEMARLYYFEDAFELVTYPVGDEVQVEGIRVGRNAGQYELATDARAQVLVPYVGPSVLSGRGEYPYVSATDVLNGRVDREVLENALVLVGTTATGMFDLRSTPLEAVYPGVEVHANILNAILDSFVVQEVEAGSQTTLQGAMASLQSSGDSTFPYKPVWEDGAILVVLLVGGVLLSLVLPYLGPALLGLATLVLVVAAVWANFELWAVSHMDLSLTLVLVLVLALSVVNTAYGFLSERFTRKTIKGMFDQYVPPAHIDAMLADPDAYSFDGESREMTVLFADIRDFTSVSEALTASGLKQLLNEFFTPVTAIIFAHNGTVDKYVGDMIMAFWGAPLEDPQHRDNAVATALEILLKLEELQEEFPKKGFPPIRIGIGINTGMMNVGDMGSVYRRAYTVLGDAVNLGSRLEGLTKFYGVKLLIGEETYKGLDGYLCRLIDKVKVKGKDQAVNAYEPICLLAGASAAMRERVAQYHEALECYFARDWDGAQEGFSRLQVQEPQTRLYELYLERIATLREHPPADDWDGAYQHLEK